jgi:hypothetical protein
MILDLRIMIINLISLYRSTEGSRLYNNMIRYSILRVMEWIDISEILILFRNSMGYIS